MWACTVLSVAKQLLRFLKGPSKLQRLQKYVNSSILNVDWLVLLQVRFSIFQSHTDAILVGNHKLLLLSCVEAYGQDPLLEAHYEKTR